MLDEFAIKPINMGVFHFPEYILIPDHIKRIQYVFPCSAEVTACTFMHYSIAILLVCQNCISKLSQLYKEVCMMVSWLT